MRNILKTAVIFLVFFISTLTTSSQNRSIKFEAGNWQNILDLAKKENKMIYLDCYTSWCMPCKVMAKTVFTNDTAADFYNANFINVEMDMEKGEGAGLQKKYNVRSYPTMLYLNSEGVQLHRVSGGTSAKVFIENGKDALDPKKQLTLYEAKFKSDTSNSIVAASYFKMLKDISQPTSKEAESYFATQKESDLLSSANWKIIYSDIYNTAGRMYGNALRVYNYFELNKSKYVSIHGIDSVDAVIDLVYNYELYFASKDETKASFDLLKKNYKAAATKNGDRYILYADLHYYQSHKDWQNYAPTAIAYIEKYAGNNRYELSGDANMFYEYVDDKEQLKKAEEWSRHAVELDQNNYMFNAVYGSVLYKLGKKSDAKSVIERSIELAKKYSSDYSEMLVLLNKINKAE